MSTLAELKASKALNLNDLAELEEKYGPLADMMVSTNVDNTPFKIPTKLITLTYNNEKIESYE